jgi:hypothetical protein
MPVLLRKGPEKQPHCFLQSSTGFPFPGNQRAYHFPVPGVFGPFFQQVIFHHRNTNRRKQPERRYVTFS